MRDVDSDTLAALTAARTAGLVERDLLTIFARDRSDNSIVTFGFWSDVDTITINVLSGQDGTEVSRDFVGDGAMISIGAIPNVSDLTIRRVSVTMSQLHATVQDMVRGYDVRLADAEIHRVLLDTVTRNVVAPPYCHYVGQVNTSPLGTPSVGGEGSVTIEIVSDTRELTRTNPQRRSDQTQQRRSGDRMLRYASLTGNIRLYWGEATVGTPE